MPKRVRNQSLLDIIQHTPVWAFCIFFILLILGFIQTRDRKTSVRVVFILPTAMIIFSLFGVYSISGFELSVMCAWVVSLSVMTMLGINLLEFLGFPRSATYSYEHRKLIITGSWTPLFLMMTVFFTRYSVGVATAKELAITHDVYFPLGVSVVYGIFSGAFLSRSLVIFRVTQKQRS